LPKSQALSSEQNTDRRWKWW